MLLLFFSDIRNVSSEKISTFTPLIPFLLARSLARMLACSLACFLSFCYCFCFVCGIFSIAPFAPSPLCNCCLLQQRKPKKYLSTFTSLIPFIVVVVFCWCVVFVAPFPPPSPTMLLLFTSAEEAQNLIGLVASVWVSSPHFFCCF